MSYNGFQKIILHTTSNLVKDQEIIDYEREAVQKIMMENHINFSIEIEEISVTSASLKNTGSAYSLNLIVGKYDLDKVIEVLDKDGGFGYYIDFDEEYDPNENSEESAEKIDDDPIKTFGKKEDECELSEDAKFENLAFLIIRLFLIFAGGLIILFELFMMVKGIKELEYELSTTAFVMIVVEIPMLVCFYNLLKKK